MKKDELIKALTKLENDLKLLQKVISKQAGPQIKQQSIKEMVLRVARSWFEEIEKYLEFYGVANEIVSKYQKLFDNLLQMGFKNALKTRYVAIIGQLRQSFNSDIAVPVFRFSGDISSFAELDAILDSLTEEEKPLMKEAIECARSNFLRASVVLGWAAMIYRLHKSVEKMGFDNFNNKAEELSKIQDGRYKRVGKTNYHVHNMSELQATVVDNALLWVLEYIGLIDNNQHDRLSACSVMRNNSAHPSSTTITEENVTSFYSDLKTIIFDNSKFKLENKPIESTSNVQSI